MRQLRADHFQRQRETDVGGRFAGLRRRAQRSAPLLTGFRGRPAVNLEALVEAIRAVADYACEHVDNLLELDVNPLLADAEGAVAVDALIRTAE